MPVDRATTTPFLVRVFSAHGGFHNLNEFDFDLQPRNEINIYSWKDTTLGELTALLAKQLVGDPRRSLLSYKFSYRLVFGDNNRGRYQTRDIGVVQLNTKSSDSSKTLESARFVIGDWVDIAVLQPGDRLYDARPGADRDVRPSRTGRDGAGNRHYTDDSRQYRGNNYDRKPYDRRDSNIGGRRWGGDSYRPARR